MRCEDCLPLIEEYFDGETDARTAASVGAHLSKCADCAAAPDAPGGSDEPANATPNKGPVVVETPRLEGPQRDLVARVERARYVPGGVRRAPEADVMTLINEQLAPPQTGNVVAFKPDDHDA